jgi:hypothetical protein
MLQEGFQFFNTLYSRVDDKKKKNSINGMMCILVKIVKDLNDRAVCLFVSHYYHYLYCFC